MPNRIDLQDDSFPILAHPIAVSRDTRGRFIITDDSDKDLKVYDATGKRIRTIGGPGRNPGSFVHLNAGGTYGDSILGYDFYSKALTIFAYDGRVARVMRPEFQPYAFRVVDDSLLLLIRHPGQGGPLLAIARLDGEVVSRFFEPQTFFADNKLRWLSVVNADAKDGVVRANLFGDDTLYSFDYRGRPLQATAIRASEPLPRMDALLRLNGGRAQNADNSWFHNGITAVFGVTAVNNTTVALQVARYDTHVGTDLLTSASELIVIHTLPSAPTTTSVPSHGAMLGLDADGALLTISRSVTDSSTLVLNRVKVQ